MLRHTLLLLGIASLAGCGQETAAPTVEQTAPSTAPPVAAPTAAENTANTDLGSLKYRSSCAGCHGRNGEGSTVFPKLAGQSEQDLATKLRDYRAGKPMGKQTAMMAPNAQNLSDADIDALAKYIANLGTKG